MPVSYTYDEADDLLVWTTEDPVTLEDWENAFDRADRDPVVQKALPRRMIVDLRNRAAFNAGGTVRSLATGVSDRLSRQGRSGLRVAFLVSGGLGHGMVRMAGAFSDWHLMEFEIFRNIEEARTWLRNEVKV